MKHRYRVHIRYSSKKMLAGKKCSVTEFQVSGYRNVILKTTFLHEANREPPQTRATAFPTAMSERGAVYGSFATIRRTFVRKSLPSQSCFQKVKYFFDKYPFSQSMATSVNRASPKKVDHSKKCGFLALPTLPTQLFYCSVFHNFFSNHSFYTFFPRVGGGGRQGLHFQARESVSLFAVIAVIGGMRSNSRGGKTSMACLSTRIGPRREGRCIQYDDAITPPPPRPLPSPRCAEAKKTRPEKSPKPPPNWGNDHFGGGV